MRSQWILPIFKCYPYIVKAVVDRRDGRHNPLILCGVVGNTDVLNKLSTKLPLMIEIFTPFRTSSGEEISLQFACGDNVSVNCILGMPYFKQFGAVLDTVHHKVIAQKVYCNPFDISYKMPSSEAPKLPKGATKFNQKKFSTTTVISIATLARRADGVGPQPPKCAEPAFPAIDFAAAPTLLPGL